MKWTTHPSFLSFLVISLPVTFIATRTQTILEMMKLLSIPNRNLSANYLGDEFDSTMTALAHI
jgi:hypothetical protein